ncbi:MAG TPA: hypothetical protein VM076_13130 [Gemmatimonadaceae bacterium]|nr:hypothetical protein [Gemmatimonadaceae bacterium]
MPRMIKEPGRTVATGSKAIPRRESASATYVAVVHTVDGVRFQATATSRRELIHRIAEYVQRWGGYVLRPDHARHLRGLLLRGEWEAAVELYFGLVGKRWDKEWLVTTVAGPDKSVATELGGVVTLDGARVKETFGPKADWRETRAAGSARG